MPALDALFPNWLVGLVRRSQFALWFYSPWIYPIGLGLIFAITLIPPWLDYWHLLDPGLIAPGGWLQTKNLRKAVWVLTLLTLLPLLVQKPRQHLLKRALICSAVGLIAATSFSQFYYWASHKQLLRQWANGSLYERQWDNIRRLHLLEPHVPTLAGFQSRRVVQEPVETFGQLHDWVVGQWAIHQADLLRELPGRSASEVKALFYLNFVANLWSFGNKDHQDKVGSVLNNERNQWQGKECPTVRDYLDSPIACCSDMAHLLKFLWDKDQIPNRVVSIPGHTFNEVCLQGRWAIADPTLNLFCEKSWDEVQGKTPTQDEEGITILLLPHSNLRPGDQERYRALVGQFRLMMLLRVANRTEIFRKAHLVDQPRHLQEELH